MSCCYWSATKLCSTLCNTWTAACQAFLSFAISQNLPKLMSIESVMPSNHLILWHPLLLFPSISPSIRIFLWKMLSLLPKANFLPAPLMLQREKISTWLFTHLMYIFYGISTLNSPNLSMFYSLWEHCLFVLIKWKNSSMTVLCEGLSSRSQCFVDF